jgi:CheY-like chemotaxis protein
MCSFTDVLQARVLIVDDQQSNVRLLEHALRRGGYVAVSSTTEPLDVCALHRLNPYDLILLDLQMPGMSGFEVMAAMDCIESIEAPAVLVLSGDPSQMLRAVAAGADDFLSKPYELVEVLRRVRRLLEKRMSAEIVVPLPPLATAPAPHVIH